MIQKGQQTMVQNTKCGICTHQFLEPHYYHNPLFNVPSFFAVFMIGDVLCLCSYVKKLPLMLLISLICGRTQLVK